MPAVASLSRRLVLCIALRLSFWRGALRPVHDWHCGSVDASYIRCALLRFYHGVLPRFMPGDAFLSWCFASVHACCLPHSAKQDGLRYLAFLFRGSRSPFVRSRGVGAVIFLGRFTSGLCAYLWRSRRGCRGHGGFGERGTGLAARLLCVFARAHWLCCAFRGEYAGAARPRLRQRVFDSLDSLHAAAGLGWCVFVAFVRLCAGTLAL